ncbi:MAG: hypothetical protein H6815_09530 [Phycisphaeraceae bacterium]|nr:hypothetical protein [Phycisphaerales bacterium]MCB9860678.1 hypothetical protein [Phycisphaeraceae bacterium]
MKHVPKLTSLPYTARIGIAVLMLTLLGGYVVSGIHLKTHYDNRDGSPGFTLGDIRGHYHGVQSPSPLVASLQQDHPDAETLPDDKRKALLDWLAETDKLSEQYDNFDLGDNAPAEIIAVSCLDCHSRNSTGPDAHPSVPLEFWSDIQEIAFSKDIQPTSEAVLAMSQHTHAPTMAVILIIVGLLACMTRLHGQLTGIVLLAGGLGLGLDMASWWLARSNEVWINVLVAGGTVYAIAIGLLGAVVVIDCLIPSFAKQSGSASN